MNVQEDNISDEMPKAKPKTIDEALQLMELTPEEEFELEEKKMGELSKPEATEPNPDPDAIPSWVKFPEGFKIPRGKSVGWAFFKAEWTDSPEKGDRHCIFWPLSDADEKMASKRTRGESGRTMAELTKGMIRAIDGHNADWTGKASDGSVDRFWNEIGGKCRGLLINLYIKTHSLPDKARDDFFQKYVGFRHAVAG